MSNTITSTLFDKLQQLTGSVGKFDKLIKYRPEDLPFTQTHDCVVCGTPKLDNDITGVTCGSVKCLNELGVMVVDELKLDKERVDWQKELKTKEGDLEYREQEVEELEGKFDVIIESLNAMCLILGVPYEPVPQKGDKIDLKIKYLVNYCELIQDRLDEFAEEIELLQQIVDDKADQ